MLAPLAVYNTGYAFRINDVFVMNDSTWIACGGIRGNEGIILKTMDSGNSWSRYESEFSKSIYSLKFLNDQIGLAGGDYLHLWKTTDGGNTWAYNWLADQVPFNEEDRPAIQDIEFKSDSSWFFCGGENFGEGVIYESRDAGNDWDFVFRQNEFRAMILLGENEIVTGGHGVVLVANNHIDSLSVADFRNDFITGLTKTGSDECIAVTLNGAILKGTNSGSNWTQLAQGNNAFKSRINWSDVDSFEKHLVAVGNEGVVAESVDGGANWQYFEVINTPELIAVSVVEKFVIATTGDGKIIRLF